MSVYFCRVGRLIKIGSSYDPCLRTTRYWFGAHVPLEVYRLRAKVQPEMLRIVEGNKNDERGVHQALAEHRMEGEWFADCQPVRDFIANYREPKPDDPDFGPCGCGTHDSTIDAHPPVTCEQHDDEREWVGPELYDAMREQSKAAIDKVLGGVFS